MKGWSESDCVSAKPIVIARYRNRDPWRPFSSIRKRFIGTVVIYIISNRHSKVADFDSKSRGKQQDRE